MRVLFSLPWTLRARFHEMAPILGDRPYTLTELRNCMLLGVAYNRLVFDSPYAACTSFTLTPSEDRGRPLSLDFELPLPAMSNFTLTIPFTKVHDIIAA